MRLFIPFFLLLALTACSIFPSVSAKEANRSKNDTNHSAELEYATGKGKTKAEALQAARSILSEQIYTHVHSEFKAIQKHISDSENKQVTNSSRIELNNFTANYSNTRLSKVKIIKEERTPKWGLNKHWFVTVSIPHNEMEEARARADRQAPALAYALLMNNDANLSAGALLRYALLGLNKTLEQEIGKEVIYAPGIAPNTTFDSFFITAIEQAKKRLHILPITDDDRIQFALVDSTTFEPQTGFVIYIEGHNLETNRSGVTRFVSLETLPEQFSPALIGYSDILNSSIDKNLLKADSIHTAALKDFNKTTIYVYTEPSNSLVTLMNASKTLEVQASPALFIVDAELTALKLNAETESSAHSNFNELIAQPRSKNLYYSVQLTEKSFGNLSLSVINTKNRITLKDATGEVVASGSNLVNERIEVGRYHVHIENDNKDKYQSIDENITLYKNSEFKREYKELINRDEYFFGSFNDFNFGYAPSLNDDLNIPMQDGSSIKAKEFIKDYNSDYNYSYALNFRHMRLQENALAISAGLDFSSHHYNERDTDNKAFLLSYGAHLGVGLWKGFATNQVAWITANYNYSYYDWHFFDSERKSPASKPNVKSFNRGYPFIDIGTRWETFGLGVRLSDPKFAAPALYLSFGATKTDSNYTFDAHSTAVEGIHF